MKSLQQLQRELSISTAKGTPMLYAGILFWFLAGLSYFFIPEDVRFWVYIYGVGIIFPLGILISKFLKKDLFVHDNPLSSLAGLLGAMQILFIPVVLIFIAKNPAIIPYVLAVLTGAHFLPFSWVYQTKWYLIHSFAIIGIALISFYIPNGLMVFLPFALVIEYSIITCFLSLEVKRLKATQDKTLSI